MKRRTIQPDDKITIRMSARDHDLLLEDVFINPEYLERLRPAPSGRGLVGEFTLDDLEDILGNVAATANHSEEPKLKMALDDLFDRILLKQRSYDDGDWNDNR